MSSLDTNVTDFADLISESSSLTEWRAWFAMLLALCLGIAIASTFGLVDYAIYAAMAALIAFAFYSSYRDVRSLDAEVKAASRQMQRLVELDDIEAFLEETRQNRDFSYLRSHINALYQIFLVSSEIHQDTLVEVLNSRLLARNRKVELHSSVLITVGLIGTIVGLIYMMTQMSRDILASAGSGGDIMTLLVADGGALSGLGIAFYTTLIGALFGGVILRILTSVVEEGITKYVALLAELTEVNVLPILRSHSGH